MCVPVTPLVSSRHRIGGVRALNCTHFSKDLLRAADVSTCSAVWVLP